MKEERRGSMRPGGVDGRASERKNEEGADGGASGKENRLWLTENREGRSAAKALPRRKRDRWKEEEGSR